MNRLPALSATSVIGLLAMGLLLAGAQGPWLDFPLTASIYPKDLAFSLPHLGQASCWSLLLGFTLLAGVGWLFGLRLLMLSGGFGVVVLLSYFLSSWTENEQWLSRFLTESEQRDALQAFISHYYWPNLNPEPTTTLKSDFEYLSDQLLVFWYAAGWGWGLCVIGVILLLLENLISTVVAGLASVAIMLLGVLSLGVILYPGFSAELNHRRGDELLGSGRPRAALAAFETTLRLNPALKYSDSFLKKSSRAYYQLEGENSLLGGLYLTSFRTRWVTGEVLNLPAEQHLDKSTQILADVIHAAYQGSALEMAILSQAFRVYSKFLVEQGLDAYAEGNLPHSLELFEAALRHDRKQVHAGFFLAHVQRELDLTGDSVATLQQIIDQVQHESLRADMLCTIGDAYARGDKPLQAREAYLKCLDTDSLFNFRAVLDLGGT